MKLLKIVLTIALSHLLWTWIEGCGPWLYLSDIVPFAKSQSHSFVYDYTGCIMLGLTCYGMWRHYGRRH